MMCPTFSAVMAVDSTYSVSYFYCYPETRRSTKVEARRRIALVLNALNKCFNFIYDFSLASLVSDVLSEATN